MSAEFDSENPEWRGAKSVEFMEPEKEINNHRKSEKGIKWKKKGKEKSCDEKGEEMKDRTSLSMAEEEKDCARDEEGPASEGDSIDSEMDKISPDGTNVKENHQEHDFWSNSEMIQNDGRRKKKEENSQEKEANSEWRREHLYKILVIGELGTGKTSIIKRYVHQFFSQHYRATIGVDFALKVLHWDQNTIVRLQLWDIAGQERFGNMTRVYYKEAVGAFIVFDVTRSATFEAVQKWKQDLDSKIQLSDGSPIPCILLANKCDQPKEGLVNNHSKLDEYCREKGFTSWYETSAKENINIEEAAKSLVNQILQNDKLIRNGDHLQDSEKFALGEKPEKPDRKTCSC